MIVGVIDQLNKRIPPFVRTDLLQIIFTQGLSIGNLSKIYDFFAQVLGSYYMHLLLKALYTKMMLSSSLWLPFRLFKELLPKLVQVQT